MTRFCDIGFSEAVYDIVRLIPPGRATSYGAIAHAVGHPAYSRLVGRVMGQCAGSDSPADNGIPAHRVVNSQGELSGKAAFGPGDEMQRRLEAEGIRIINNRIQQWKTVFWDPLHEL